MSATGLHTLDDAPRVVGTWLEELREAVDFEDTQRSYNLLRTVLHTLRDWLSTDEAAQLSAQLPMLMRGIYYEGWNPSQAVSRPRGKREFIKHIDAAFEEAPLHDTDACVSAVFALLEQHVSSGEMRDVKGSMPKDLKPLFSQDLN